MDTSGQLDTYLDPGIDRHFRAGSIAFYLGGRLTIGFLHVVFDGDVKGEQVLIVSYLRPAIVATVAVYDFLQAELPAVLHLAVRVFLRAALDLQVVGFFARVAEVAEVLVAAAVVVLVVVAVVAVVAEVPVLVVVVSVMAVFAAAAVVVVVVVVAAVVVVDS